MAIFSAGASDERRLAHAHAIRPHQIVPAAVVVVVVAVVVAVGAQFDLETTIKG